MITFFVFVLILALVVIGYFLRKNKPSADFNLEKPVFQQYLSKDLKEVSGISFFADNKVICVNDEMGKLFIYDFEKEAIVDTIDFEADGDYEAVEYVEPNAYILQSNGLIIAFDIASKTSKTLDCRQDEVEEYEGLGYDPKSNSLLLAAKEMKGEKAIFQFDLKNEILSKKFSISKDDIKKNGKHGKEFKPSGIAVHPISTEIYVLASAGKKLLIFDKNGNKKHQYNLDDDQFPQPEGICFTPNGDLIIASEGKNREASISYFSYEVKK